MGTCSGTNVPHRTRAPYQPSMAFGRSRTAFVRHRSEVRAADSAMTAADVPLFWSELARSSSTTLPPGGHDVTRTVTATSSPGWGSGGSVWTATVTYDAW